MPARPCAAGWRRWPSPRRVPRRGPGRHHHRGAARPPGRRRHRRARHGRVLSTAKATPTIVVNKPGAAGEIAAVSWRGFARWCNPADGQQQHHGGRAAGSRRRATTRPPTSALWAASRCSTPSSWRTSRSASAAWRTVTITSALWSEDGLLPLLTGLLQSPEHSRGSRPSWFALRKR